MAVKSTRTIESKPIKAKKIATVTLTGRFSRVGADPTVDVHKPFARHCQVRTRDRHLVHAGEVLDMLLLTWSQGHKVTCLVDIGGQSSHVIEKLRLNLFIESEKCENPNYRQDRMSMKKHI